MWCCCFNAAVAAGSAALLSRYRTQPGWQQHSFVGRGSGHHRVVVTSHLCAHMCLCVCPVIYFRLSNSL